MCTLLSAQTCEMYKKKVCIRLHLHIRKSADITSRHRRETLFKSEGLKRTFAGMSFSDYYYSKQILHNAL